MDVTDKIAIVTGGGRGIGRGISLVLARHGANIVVADLIEDNAQAVADEVRALGRKSLALSLDVTSQASADAMVAEVMAQFGQIDILVNNAGIIGAPGWESRDTPNEDDWDMIYAVNVKGIAKVTNAVSPHMVARRYGKIINIASIAGRQRVAHAIRPTTSQRPASSASLKPRLSTWPPMTLTLTRSVPACCGRRCGNALPPVRR